MPLLSSLSVQYLPQVGYLIVIPKDQIQLISNDNNNDNFDFVFQQNDNYYYKNNRMRGFLFYFF